LAKKRVIFTLLYCDGGFMLSRNFRLQRAGDVNWLLKNYRFNSVATSIDEIIIVNVSRGAIDMDQYLRDVRMVIASCFVPVALGGRIADLETAQRLIASGADKVVINSGFDADPELITRVADRYGSQCVIGGIDVKRNGDGSYDVFTGQGSERMVVAPAQRVRNMLEAGAGEILVQSIDQDGTGNGFDFDSLVAINSPITAPVIICGGCGKSEHMHVALLRDDVDAVATANLFNFIGNGLNMARRDLLATGLDLAQWNVTDIEDLQKGAHVR
jgi:imidazole glycerol-phosphate synthase subunit HisF